MSTETVAPAQVGPELFLSRYGEVRDSIIGRDWDATDAAHLSSAQEKAAALINADDTELYELIQGVVYDEALRSRFRGNQSHYYALTSVAYAEAELRPRASCNRHSIYARAHRRTVIDCGHEPGPLPVCSCEGVPA